MARFASVGDRVLLATDFGIVVIRDTEVTGFFVDRTTDGRLRIAEGISEHVGTGR